MGFDSCSEGMANMGGGGPVPQAAEKENGIHAVLAISGITYLHLPWLP